MRLPLVLILPVLFIGLLVDWYIARAVGQRCTHARRFWRAFARITAYIGCATLLALICTPKRSGGDEALRFIMWVLFAYFSVYLPKYLFCIFDLMAKIPQLFRRKRIKALSISGVALACILFFAMWWGALINRYDIDVNRVEISDSRLPAAFDGLTIAQISDLHIGTYGTDTTFVDKLVATINGLKPDVVVFTGDIVNRHSAELEPFTGTMSRLKAPMGVYSILGNHDYGDYYNWPSDAAKAENMELMYRLQAGMGWRLLRNETAWLRRGNDSIALIGVENVGDPPFHVYGSLPASYTGNLADATYKILLSHNPAHWVQDIATNPANNIALTLSGHTHAMQMSAFGLSPAAFRYPTWGGMYADSDSLRRLYVNIGAGEVGIPARIGATPEITLFTLRK
ncbi:MAG: metallophosphoesterase [Muribaculaceae bacterium]|nr:metallophosphoesterase [Muribaculaceae bacterium]